MTATASGGGGGRDVVFKLKIVPDDLSGLKKFGDEVKKRQKDFDDTALGAAKKLAKEKERLARDAVAWHENLRRKSAEMEQRDAVTALRKRAAEEKRYRENEARERARLEKRIADNHVREHLQALKREEADRRASLRRQESEALASARREAQARSQIRMSRIAGAEGLSKAGSGALTVGRGLAYSGLVGEEDAAKLLQKLLMIEASFETLRGGIDIWKGLTQWAQNYGKAVEAAGTIKLGGTIGSALLPGGAAAGGGLLGGGGAGGGGSVAIGGTAMTAAAGLAAVASAALAAVSALQTIGDARKHGFMGGADHGSWRDKVGTRLAEFESWDYSGGRASNAWLEREANEGNQGAYTILQRRRMGKQITNTALDAPFEFIDTPQRQMLREQRGRINEGLGALGSTRFKNLDDARSALKEAKGFQSDLQPYSGIGGSKEAAEAVANIEAENLRLLREQGNTAVQSARERVALSLENYNIAKETTEEIRRQALEGRGIYTSDTARYGLMTPEEQHYTRQIATKQKHGEHLTPQEIEFASQFKSMQEFAGSEAVRLGEKAGAGDVFSGAKAESDRLAAEARKSAEKTSKAELTLKRDQEVVVRLEASEGLEGALKEEFDKLAKTIADRDAQLEANIISKIKRDISQFRQNQQQVVK